MNNKLNIGIVPKLKHSLIHYCQNCHIWAGTVFYFLFYVAKSASKFSDEGNKNERWPTFWSHVIRWRSTLSMFWMNKFHTIWFWTVQWEVVFDSGICSTFLSSKRQLLTLSHSCSDSFRFSSWNKNEDQINKWRIKSLNEILHRRVPNKWVFLQQVLINETPTQILESYCKDQSYAGARESAS